MKGYEIVDYILNKFIKLDASNHCWKPITKDEAIHYAYEAQRRGYCTRSAVKNYLFHSVGLSWK